MDANDTILFVLFIFYFYHRLKLKSLENEHVKLRIAKTGENCFKFFCYMYNNHVSTYNFHFLKTASFEDLSKPKNTLGTRYVIPAKIYIFLFFFFV